VTGFIPFFVFDLRTMTTSSTTIRVALYCRVSTSDQNCELQLRELRDYVSRRGWTISGEFIDHGASGAKNSRPELDKLMRSARRREFDVVIVWRFDRFARPVKHLVLALEEFESLGIDFVSYQEALDTSTPIGKAMFTIIGEMAELERNVIRERVRAGVRNARRNGKALGRRRIVFDRSRAIELHAGGSLNSRYRYHPRRRCRNDSSSAGIRHTVPKSPWNQPILNRWKLVVRCDCGTRPDRLGAGF
jgi:DNA invertase Pin-like site-specific DNA recombinase